MCWVMCWWCYDVHCFGLSQAVVCKASAAQSCYVLVTCAKFALSQAPRPPMDRPIHGEALVKAPPVAVAPMVKAPPVANLTFSCTWGWDSIYQGISSCHIYIYNLHTHIYIYIYTYIHTHTHIYIYILYRYILLTYALWIMITGSFQGCFWLSKATSICRSWWSIWTCAASFASLDDMWRQSDTGPNCAVTHVINRKLRKPTHITSKDTKRHRKTM